MTKPIAIITGASTGLGRSLSVKLSDQYFICLISRKQEKLKKTEALILGKNNQCQIIEADVCKEDSIDSIYSQIKNKSNIELLINNAGVALFKDITKLKIKDWDKQLNTNLRAPFLMTKMIVDDLKSKKTGKIVFINSVAGINPYRDSTAYVASKHGLKGFASALREELREHNVKVISIYPGAINTPLWDDLDMDSFRSEMMDPDDVSDIIINAINAPGNCTTEEVVVRRVLGDF